MALGQAVRLSPRHANRIRGNLTGPPRIACAHEIVGLECQYPGLHLKPCFAAARCVQRLLEKAVGLRKVSCHRGCQTLAVTGEYKPIRVSRLGREVANLIGVSRRRKRVVAKPGQFNSDFVRNGLMKRFSIGRITLEEFWQAAHPRQKTAPA